MDMKTGILLFMAFSGTFSGTSAQTTDPLRFDPENCTVQTLQMLDGSTFRTKPTKESIM